MPEVQGPKGEEAPVVLQPFERRQVHELHGVGLRRLYSHKLRNLRDMRLKADGTRPMAGTGARIFDAFFCYVSSISSRIFFNIFSNRYGLDT